jgi:hypothetical protein
VDGVPAQFEVLEGGVGYIMAYGNEFVIVGRCVDPSAVAMINSLPIVPCLRYRINN